MRVLCAVILWLNAFLQMPMGSSTGHAPLPTITLAQNLAFDDPCTTTTCAAHTVSSTTAGDLAVIWISGSVATGPAQNWITAVSGMTCTSGWVIPSTMRAYDVGTASVSMAYCLNVAASQTTFTLTISAASTQDADVFYRRYHSTGAAAWSVETLVAPSVNAGCTSCTTPTLTLTGLRDVVIAEGAPAHVFTAVGGPYANSNIGTAESSAIADNFPTTSGTGATITQNTSGSASLSTIGFYVNF